MNVDSSFFGFRYIYVGKIRNVTVNETAIYFNFRAK